MADNVIKKIIQLILDKDSANKTQQDIEGVTGKIDSSFKSLATKIAGYLGVAFLTKKIIDFGRASVREATEAEAAWHNLKGTIDATGASFDAMEKQIRATTDALQDATTHDNDEFADSLTRMVTLTGDATASLNNLGLVANVASQFFGGELGPAVELVSKVMNGNITILQRMGIHVKDAQEGLDLLAKRSLGAATREAATFGGQLKSLNVLWKNFEEAVGNAIIASDGQATAFTVLRNVIEKLTTWVDDNQDAISKWVTNGVNFAIDAADVFIRAVEGMARVVGGGLATSFGLAAQGLAGLLHGMALWQKSQFANPDWWKSVIEAKRKLLGQVSETSVREEMAAGTQVLEAQAKALDEWGENMRALGTSQVMKGIDVLSTPLFSSKDFQGTPRAKRKTPGEENKPMIVKQENEKVTKALEDYAKAGLRILALQDALGPSFDKNAAELDRTRSLLEVLAEEGEKTHPMFAKLQQDLFLLTNAADPLQEILSELNRNLRDELAIAADQGATALDQLKIQQQLLGKAMAAVAKEAGRDSSVYKQLARDYKHVTDAIDEQTTAMELQADAADVLAEVMGVALAGGLHEAASKKAKQNAIEAAEMLVRAAAFALFGNFPAAGKSLALAAKYGAVAASWAALAATTKGAGGADTAQMAASGGGGATGGADVTSARETQSRDARNNQPVAPEVSIYLTGPGFDALNPAVQRVVWGASQEAQQRYGPNARVRVRSNE